MLISIFIPTYNAERCIGQTLQSVLGQTYREIEVWVVDDCSTDGTLALLREWQERDSRLHVLAKEQNEGFVPFSWVRVMPLLRGEFTLYMSHDDWLSADCVERLVMAQRETLADAVIPEVLFVYDDGTERSAFAANASAMKIGRREAFAQMLNYDIPGFALWRTELVRRVGMPTEAWNSDEGMQRIWALNCGQGVAICPSAKFYYRVTASSITKGLKPYHLTGLKTQRRLLWAALSSATWISHPKIFVCFVWQYLKSAVYLRRKLGASANQNLGEIVRFGIVGALATALHYGIYLGLVWLWPMINPSVPYSIGYIISFVANFFASNYFTFRTKPSAKKGVGFALSHVVNYLLHIGLLNLFLWLGVSETLAPIPVFCIAVPVNFLLVRLVLKR